MKRLLCLMAACLLFPCAVLAASPADDAVAYASICLTEVYGYTARTRTPSPSRWRKPPKA